MENIKEERVFYYIKRAQHVLKKLNQPLDNYTYFITHFDTVITFLQNTKKTNSNICFYCSAILSVIRYTDTISDADKQKYRKKYLNIKTKNNKCTKHEKEDSSSTDGDTIHEETHCNDNIFDNVSKKRKEKKNKSNTLSLNTIISHYEETINNIEQSYITCMIEQKELIEKLMLSDHIIEKLQKENKDLTEKLNLSDNMVSVLVDKLLEKEKEEKIVEKTEKIKNTIRFLPYNKNTHAEKCKEYTMYLTYLENRMNKQLMFVNYKQCLSDKNKIYNITINPLPYPGSDINIYNIEFYNEKNELCLPIIPPVFDTNIQPVYFQNECPFQRERQKMKNYEILKENYHNKNNKNYETKKILCHSYYGCVYFYLQQKTCLFKIKIYSKNSICFYKDIRHTNDVEIQFGRIDKPIKPYKNWTIVEQKEKENGFVTTIYFFKTHIPLI